NPELLTCAERLQYEADLRREETNAAILALTKDGVSIKQIVRLTGYSRGLVRKIIRGHRTDVFRVRLSALDSHLPWLDAQWIGGRTYSRCGAGVLRTLAPHEGPRLPWFVARCQRVG